MKNVKFSETRRQVAVVGAWNTNVLDYRNPFIVTFWSIAYAGLGHMLLDRYLRGFFLLFCEILLNYLSNLNMAIFYSISGRFVLAKEIINTKTLLLYIGIYCFAIFDSYRAAVVINNTYRLADRENAKIKVFVLKTSGFSILQKTSPLTAITWSAVIPGTGCFINERMNRAFVMLALWIVNAYLAGVYTAMIYTATGQYEAAKEAVNIHWLLNLPSLWLFSMHGTLTSVLENNKIYRRELRGFLETEYENTAYSFEDILKEV